jgi:hypothetical protein
MFLTGVRIIACQPGHRRRRYCAGEGSKAPEQQWCSSVVASVLPVLHKVIWPYSIFFVHTCRQEPSHNISWPMPNCFLHTLLFSNHCTTLICWFASHKSYWQHWPEGRRGHHRGAPPRSVVAIQPIRCRPGVMGSSCSQQIAFQIM